MTQSLFRREVLEAQRMNALGGISLAQPLRLWLLTGIATAVAISVLLFLCLGTYTRRTTVTGQLVPVKGMATVTAPVTGVITHVNVQEGDRVSAGQTIAVIRVPSSTVSDGDTLTALQARLQSQRDGLVDAKQAHGSLLAAQSSGLRKQLLVARQELQQIHAEVTTRRQQISIANETLGRLRQLESGQYVSILQIKQQESAMLEYTGQMQTLQRQATTVQRSVAQLEQALLEAPAQLQQGNAQFERDLAQLEQERVRTQAGGELVIRAPTDGVVAIQVIKEGQAIGAGQAILNVLPGNGELQAELHVPSHAIGFIRVGDTAQLRYRAFPYQKFGHQSARITRVSRSAAPESTSSGNPTLPERDSTYLVVAAPEHQTINVYGSKELLKPGALFEADVLGDKRSLIEWLFEPVESLRRK